MPDNTPNLSLPLILASQAQKHVTHNEALKLLDILVQLTVRDRTRTAPPAAPEEGDCHVVAAGATGLWAGQADRIAAWWGGVWVFLAPREGWAARVVAEDLQLVWRAGQWSDGSAQVLGAARLGIGTTADTTNRLAVAAPATLLTHAGGDHQLKLNKAGTGATGSLLYQSNWSGRAEMGLAGSDDFSVKVSADGSAWTTALTFAGATGRVTGAAVASSATDTTTGRLLRVGAGHQQLDATLYRRGNAVGTVTQAAGVPTGALIERGSNANGQFARYADGTQISWHSVMLNTAITTAYHGGFISAGAASWTYPAAFSAVPQVQATIARASAFGVALGTPLLASVDCQFLSVTSAATAADRHAEVMAVGRWF